MQGWRCSLDHSRVYKFKCGSAWEAWKCTFVTSEASSLLHKPISTWTVSLLHSMHLAESEPTLEHNYMATVRALFNPILGGQRNNLLRHKSGNNFFIRLGAQSPYKTSSWFAVSNAGSSKLEAMQAQQVTSDRLQEDSIFKLASFLNAEGESAVGLISGEAIWHMQDAVDLPADFDIDNIRDMLGVIRFWDMIKSRIVLRGEGLPLSLVKLLAPLPRPTGAIMCIGKNYADHVKEIDSWKVAPGIAAPDIPKHPIVFTKAPQSVIGHKDAIIYPSTISSQVDYEAELAVIIGKEGRGIKKGSAMSHIFGYTILNDVTARDLQTQHQQWFLGKSCDTFCPMGPCIVPTSYIDGQNLQIQCWVNGELRQNCRTSQMIFSIPELIEVISAGITLQAGDIIATGTPSGVGSGFNPPKHLFPGDTVRISVQGIGVLENFVK